MTERSTKSTGRPKTSRPSPPAKPINGGWWKTLKISLGMFAAAFALLAAHMAAGRDPKLGAATQPANDRASTVRRRVIVKRRVIVEEPVASQSAVAGVTVAPPAASSAYDSGYSSPAAPVYTPPPAPATNAS